MTSAFVEYGVALNTTKYPPLETDASLSIYLVMRMIDLENRGWSFRMHLALLTLSWSQPSLWRCVWIMTWNDLMSLFTHLTTNLSRPKLFSTTLFCANPLQGGERLAIDPQCWGFPVFFPPSKLLSPEWRRGRGLGCNGYSSGRDVKLTALLQYSMAPVGFLLRERRKNLRNVTEAMIKYRAT